MDFCRFIKGTTRAVKLKWRQDEVWHLDLVIETRCSDILMPAWVYFTFVTEREVFYNGCFCMLSVWLMTPFCSSDVPAELNGCASLSPGDQRLRPLLPHRRTGQAHCRRNPRERGERLPGEGPQLHPSPSIRTLISYQWYATRASRTAWSPADAIWLTEASEEIAKLPVDVSSWAKREGRVFSFISPMWT